MNDSLDSGLSPSQLEAATTTTGPLLIIAGPGSGKTKTLVERVVGLLSDGVPPDKIFVSTFTEKASKELITRVSNRLIDLELNINLNEMYIGTLHSIFLRILDENREFTNLSRNYTILDDFEIKYFLFRNFNSFSRALESGGWDLLGGNHTSIWDKTLEIVRWISMVSDECLSPEVLSHSRDYRIEILGNVFLKYRDLLQEENYLDFTTIQTETYRLLNEKPDILKALQDKIDYIMIDEYQDTNTIQEKILFMLAGEKQNICVVGDDDQGLYRFRGATIRNILEFPFNFDAGVCKQVTLNTNYRSHPDIINFYNDWMNLSDWGTKPPFKWEENDVSFRYPKRIVPRSDIKFVDNPSVIKVSVEASEEEYFQEVLFFINDLKNKGVLKDYNQIAFLFRSVKNPFVIGLANYLEENGISVFSPRSALFFEREEIQLLLGAIIFIFPRLMHDLKYNNEYPLGVWDYYEMCASRFADAIKSDTNKHARLLRFCNKRAKEHMTLSGNTTYAFAGLVYQLLEYPMFADYINVDLKSKKTNLRAAYNIALLTKLLFKFEYIYNITVIKSDELVKVERSLFNTYLRYLIDGGISEYEDFDEYAPSGCVSFMTIHQSKGLEFPIVVVGSLDAIPRKQYSDLDVALQNYHEKPLFEPYETMKFFDFWRLYYTAFSRAQNLLVLSDCEDTTSRHKTPSKYFKKIYTRQISWRDKDFNPKLLKLEEIKPANIKNEYSFTSHILLYESCPLKYKFYKELEFVEVRAGGVLGGSLLHQTIDDIHKAVLRGEEGKLTDINITEWFEHNYFLLSKKFKSYLHPGQKESLLKQILRYRDKQKNHWLSIKETEVEISHVSDSYILKGKIDLLQGDNNTVKIIDFKSGDKPDVNTKDELVKTTLSQYRRQLEVYAYLVEKRTGYNVSDLLIYYPKEEFGLPYLTFPPNEDNIHNTIEIFEELVNKIETLNYDMSHITKSEKQCGDCDMRYHCNPKQYN